ncbi:chymotrypsin-2-like [Bradysia coprophila]|uniref:chymotrypsin-2-like n=1 Tax=Bradysia coprophila TaxID=38358 RepID=UPI00187D922A|nr:chymotrypsin-2-like [Bradysia coprophila]
MSGYIFILLLALSATIPKCYAYSSSMENIVTPQEVINNNRTRLVGGDGAVPLGVAPFVASLRSLANVHFCGAAILNTRYVVTAAQCTAGRTAANINVVVGTVQLVPSGVTHRGSAIVMYPHFNAANYVNDIALIYTATVISFTLNIQPISLLPSIISGGDVVVYGWGLVRRPGYPEEDVNYLQFLKANVVTNEQCQLEHTPQYAAIITNRNLCALGVNPNSGTCFGDEGGPLVYVIEDPSGFTPPIYQLAGISSWQVPCGTGVPDVYIRIAPYRLWILSNIQ